MTKNSELELVIEIWDFICGTAGDRTQDLILKRDLLYQLSYRPVVKRTLEHESKRTIRMASHFIVLLFSCFYVLMFAFSLYLFSALSSP